MCVAGDSIWTEPQLAHQRIDSRLNAEMDLDILAFGAKEIRELCLPGEMNSAQLGEMTAQRWEALARQLQEIDLLDDLAVWQHAFDTRFSNGTP